MMRFFREICDVDEEKIKIQLIAHSNVDIGKAIEYWSGLTGIPSNRFIRTCCSPIKIIKNKKNRNNLTHGTVHIRINDVKLFFRIIGWIDGLNLTI